MAKIIDTRNKPARVQLTRQQKQVLECIKENPGANGETVALLIEAWPYHIDNALRALVHLRRIKAAEQLDGSSVYQTRWKVLA